MIIQMRQGNEVDFDAEKMLPGEWAVSTDARIVRMCFAPGIVIRMATYEAFEADMEQIRDVLAEAKTTEEAIERIRDEIHDTEIMVENYALSAKSYAVGSTGVRDDEDTDNAKYYYEQSKRIAQGVNGIVPMGTITFEELPTGDVVNNAMYNISNAFTSDERFNDGGGVYYGAGNNVVWTASGKWDVTAASGVTGIKGENEIDYRQGNVNITRDNIGLGDDVFGTADISAIGDGTVKGAIIEHDNKFLPLTGGTLSGDLTIQKFNNGRALFQKSHSETVDYGAYMCDFDSSGKEANINVRASINDIKNMVRFTYDKKDGNAKSYNLFGEHNKDLMAESFLPLTGGILTGAIGTQVYGIQMLLHNKKGSVYQDNNTTSLTTYKEGDGNTANGYRALCVRTHQYKPNVSNSLIYEAKESASDGVKEYEIFGEHNKPSGSYTGNGSSAKRTVDIGGLGNFLLISASNTISIVAEYGCVSFNTGSSVMGYLNANEVNFRNGVLTIATDNAGINYSGEPYKYQVV